MAEWKKLPVGLENFQEIEKSGFYYVDKTKLIEQLFENWSKVNLFTRPRRFGKTLNMSMLKSFFEIGADRTLFDGLYISRNQKLCEEYMGKYPVIFLSLKGIDGLSFEAAKYRLTELIGVEAERFAFLADSEKLTDNERSKYRAIIHLVNGKYSMDEDMLVCRHYPGWVVKSNRESGDGFADILLKPKNPDAGIIVELKDVRSLHDLNQVCERALEQIKDRRYDTELREDGRNDILAYGIAFCRKRCKVVVEKL